MFGDRDKAVKMSFIFSINMLTTRCFTTTEVLQSMLGKSKQGSLKLTNPLVNADKDVVLLCKVKREEGPL